MKLYHCFPRNAFDQDKTNLGIRILDKIIRFGLLCTPERMSIDPSPWTKNPEKLKLLLTGQPELKVVQPRFCATLCDADDLFMRRYNNQSRSHTGLFGPMAIGFDPVRARQLGFVPTIYYTQKPIPAFADQGMGEFATQIELIQRLKEVRDVLISLAFVEAGLKVEGGQLPGQAVLDDLEIALPYELKVSERLLAASDSTRREVLRFFETDRQFALNLVGSIERLLCLFQQADSTLDESVLNFFEQREWRIIHQMRSGTRWYCLGERPGFMNPLAGEKENEINELRRFINQRGLERTEQYFKHVWVLESVDGMHPAFFIDEVIVPGDLCSQVQRMCHNVGINPEIIASEDIVGKDSKDNLGSV